MAPKVEQESGVGVWTTCRGVAKDTYPIGGWHQSVERQNKKAIGCHSSGGQVREIGSQLLLGFFGTEMVARGEDDLRDESARGGEECDTGTAAHDADAHRTSQSVWFQGEIKRGQDEKEHQKRRPGGESGKMTVMIAAGRPTGWWNEISAAC